MSFLITKGHWVTKYKHVDVYSDLNDNPPVYYDSNGVCVAVGLAEYEEYKACKLYELPWSRLDKAATLAELEMIMLHEKEQI